MISLFLAEASQASSFMSSIPAIITASLGAGGAITIAINKIFDTDKIQKITALQWEIKGLERELKHIEEDLIKSEKDNKELRNTVDNLRERTNSSINTQLIDMQEKYNKLITDHRKAIVIINKLKKER